MEFGLLIEYESKYSTPNLLGKKNSKKKINGNKCYSLEQDLRASNRIVECIHSVVANPYTLLTKLRN